MILYTYTHRQTEATTGYFSCEPCPPLSLDAALHHLSAHPLDDFMRRHLLTRMRAMPGHEATAAFERAFPVAHAETRFPPAILALMRELSLLSREHKESLETFESFFSPHGPEYGPVAPVSAAAGPDGQTSQESLEDFKTCSTHKEDSRQHLVFNHFSFQRKKNGPNPEWDSEAATSLIFLRWSRLPDRALHTAWGQQFADNIQAHRALPAPSAIGLAPLYPDSFQSEVGQTVDPHPKAAAAVHVSAPLPGLAPCFTLPFPVTLAGLHAERTAAPASSHNSATAGPPSEDPLPPSRPLSAETAALAEERLTAHGIIAGREMRHTASLSPVALLRPWKVSLTVRQGRHNHSLEGEATTYGRGLSVADARASCLMEMVERASVYLSVTEAEVLHRAAPAPVVRSTRSSLLQSGDLALDPNDYPLETPYEDSLLVWMRGHTADGGLIHVPVQMAGLFCNLDEIALFDSPGSTGIATGLTLAEAKIAALTEIFERDAEATTPFSKAACFTLEADPAADPLMDALLTDYAARGINVQFQDLTGPTGLSVYKCFVMNKKGVISRGHGAGLNSRRAIIAALTETPFPYPESGPSGPMLRKLSKRTLSELPDYSLPTPAENLALLENLLTANHRPPVYVELTRADLAFPVVRAFIPGMQLAADSDAFCRVPPRLYANYLKMFADNVPG